MKLPSPAMIVSLIALFVALSGTSYAVIQLPKNSVGTEQIKDRSILVSDIKSSEIGKLRGRAGAKGDTGETGARGPAGPSNTSGSTVPQSATSSSAAKITGANVALPVGAPGTEVLSLISTNTATTGPIQVNAASRLAVTGDLTLRADGSVNDRGVTVQCALQVRFATDGGTWGSPAYSSVSTAFIPRPSAPSSSPTGGMSVSGATDVAAGTYDVRVLCYEASYPYSATFMSGQISVIAIPT